MFKGYLEKKTTDIIACKVKYDVFFSCRYLRFYFTNGKLKYNMLYKPYVCKCEVQEIIDNLNNDVALTNRFSPLRKLYYK